ncbi:MAG: hypothetical protein BWY82_03039 [Verrucomicrobia bacterium ADurb.Bin474]|nr:MAG: hypothetical protein BWY82_03039 [Verrucomicrobia bacterium ADurb.Bin474]
MIRIQLVCLVLGKVTDDGFGTNMAMATLIRFLSGDDPRQSRFSGSVDSDNGNPLPFFQFEVESTEEG